MYSRHYQMVAFVSFKCRPRVLDRRRFVRDRLGRQSKTGRDGRDWPSGTIIEPTRSSGPPRVDANRVYRHSRSESNTDILRQVGTSSATVGWTLRIGREHCELVEDVANWSKPFSLRSCVELSAWLVRIAIVRDTDASDGGRGGNRPRSVGECSATPAIICHADRSVSPVPASTTSATSTS